MKGKKDMNKILIEKKYNKQLNIFLGIYVILCLIFALLYNGFFVEPKAFSNNFQYTIRSLYEIPNTPYHNKSLYTVKSNGNTRCIFYYDKDFKNIIQQNYNYGASDKISLIRINSNSENLGGSLTGHIEELEDTGLGLTPWDSNYQFVDIENNQLYNYFSNKGYNFPTGINNVCNVLFYHSYVDYNPDKLASFTLETDIQYVDNPHDLYEYIVNGNDSVVKTGDPENPEIDKQIPTPQKVAIYKNSDSPTLVWANPKGVSGNESIGVEIEWKPTLVLTQNLYDVRTITSNDYIDLYKGDLLDYNAYCVLLNNSSSPPNVLNSYNTLFDSKPIYSGYNDNYTDDWTDYLIDLNGINNVQRINPLEPTNIFASGTYSGTRVPELSYRIRYYTNSGVSDWVYSGRTYDSDNVSGPSQHSTTHFKNSSGEPISNPTYIPNNDNNVIPQNEVDEQNNPDNKKSSSIFDFISGFFDTIIQAITSIFSKLKELVDSISNGTGSFFTFFADMFGAFPQLLGIFLLGLVVTVLLRVLGR